MNESERKDEIIAALTEMVQELNAKLINLRVDAGLKLKEKDRQIEDLSGKRDKAEDQPPDSR